MVDILNYTDGGLVIILSCARYSQGTGISREELRSKARFKRSDLFADRRLADV
ncbi:hypothetical protein APY04_1400 [Hyphomicrobium sulfonivorans]|uniref:Uncharacterized protein n=1 Tax=Hyphomicrobium sulfonivorans TaxID=121290 RepID=A0A109BJV4_HYPSL|nr:hypothetical protein APY04_1400 [Hyphomicrobium sulfonivorans]